MQLLRYRSKRPARLYRMQGLMQRTLNKSDVELASTVAASMLLGHDSDGFTEGFLLYINMWSIREKKLIVDLTFAMTEFEVQGKRCQLRTTLTTVSFLASMFRWNSRLSSKWC